MGEVNTVTFSPEESAAVRTAIVDARAKKEDPKAAAQKVIQNGLEEVVKDPAQAEPAPTPPILGKFKTQADLEKAYKELEAKLGSKTEAPKAPEAAPKATEDAPKGTEEVKAGEALESVGLNLSTFQQEYTEKGSLTEESYKALADKGIPKEIVDQFIEGQTARSAMAEQRLMVDAGFADTGKFGQAVEWAKNNWDPKSLDSYNKAIATNNPDAAKLALQSLKNAHENSMGNEPRMVSGERSGSTGSDEYESMSELVTDQKDKRYKTDPAFRAKVEAKLSRSNKW